MRIKPFHGIKVEDFRALVISENKGDPQEMKDVAKSITYATKSVRHSNRIASREGYCPVDDRVITSNDLKQSITGLRGTTHPMPPELSSLIAEYAEPTRKWKWKCEPFQALHSGTLAEHMVAFKSMARHQIHRIAWIRHLYRHMVQDGCIPCRSHSHQPNQPITHPTDGWYDEVRIVNLLNACTATSLDTVETKVNRRRILDYCVHRGWMETELF